MSRSSRPEGPKSELEVSLMPEVAGLATELMTLFTSLGITQQQYAVRTNFDKSYISRFLNGRRVASIEFMDRLIEEVEKHRNTKVTEETRIRLFSSRSSALRAFDPGLHRLESLRSELDRSQRDIRRLLLHQEALENLLDRRQTEARELCDEFSQLQSDWIADRINHEASELIAKGENGRLSDERDELKLEIKRLRHELNLTIQQKEQAEARCRELESEVDITETDIAQELDDEGVEEANEPIEMTFSRILNLAESNPALAYREISECTFLRTSSDNAKLFYWFTQKSLHGFAEQVASDYPRLHEARRVAEFILQIEELGFDPYEIRFDGSLISKQLKWRDFDSLVEFLRHLTAGRQARSNSNRKNLVETHGIATSWMNSDRAINSTSREAPRAPYLAPLYDELLASDGQRSVNRFMRMLAMRNGRADRYLLAASDAKRWDVVEKFMRTWVPAAGALQVVRTGEVICLSGDARLIEILMEGLSSDRSVNHFARILVTSLSDRQGPKKTFATRLMSQALKYHEAASLEEAVINFQVAFENSDPGAQRKHEDARAEVISHLRRLPKN
ncbi:helix-turn-helix transcriptional regulator [Streptomyces sp. DH8]|uniref:helix-turn-helix domain-containing protein n=1 Tax=Streptomyces sp. DH8 TaxID=2857008 RepID=UPI001E3AB714|nr:helix-turn-helix transcriptional regulator [Streptomyces sp. DH8]